MGREWLPFMPQRPLPPHPSHAYKEPFVPRRTPSGARGADPPRDRLQDDPQPQRAERLLAELLHRLRPRLRLLLRPLHAAFPSPRRALGGVRRREGQRRRGAQAAVAPGAAGHGLRQQRLRRLAAGRGRTPAHPPLLRAAVGTGLPAPRADKERAGAAGPGPLCRTPGARSASR